MAEDKERSREIRVALVLYGGVSLAIYENGVTRCFYELVRGRGVFGLLLDLLDARAIVDVVAGTSAGGINGILLAAALESGQEFAITEPLWRSLGDLGDLLRSAKDADTAQSLLDGEGYYQAQLIDALKKLCTPDPTSPPNYEDFEIDVFVTGTDLGGRLVINHDRLGDEIRDQEHRIVFQLKHRPNRKRLGLKDHEPEDAKTDDDIAEQAAILGAISRLTSSFPIAFPPFRVQDIERVVPGLGGKVADALKKTAQLSLEEQDRYTAGCRSFVDGGVLNNKPFGPALEAIFYRMPSGEALVDRRLFYVEPDPEPFKEQPKEKYSAIEVGVASLTTIPSHQSLVDDLQHLKEHNERINWLAELREQIRGALASEDPASRPMAKSSSATLYAATRRESLARSLVVAGDASPSAQEFVAEPARKELFKRFHSVLDGYPLESIDPYDADFHVRRTFHVLYSLLDHVEEARRPTDVDPRHRTAVSLVARVVKAMKLVRDVMADFRDKLVPTILKNVHGAPGTGKNDEDAQAVLRAFWWFLTDTGSHWKPLLDYCRDGGNFDRFAATPRKFFLSQDLTATLVAARKQASVIIDGVHSRGLAALPDKAPDLTILDQLAGALRAVVQACDGNPNRFADFVVFDEGLYPLKFMSGIHELDVIQYVRISPQDAQRGLSHLEAHKKVAGDELAHFSAFLRRDWRSNDILYGRLDGTCQIIQTLLDGKAIQRLRDREADFAWLSDPKEIAQRWPDWTPARCKSLAGAWESLTSAWDDESTQQKFRDELILAGQQAAFAQAIASIYEDLHYQEIAFGHEKTTDRASRGADAGAAPAVVQQAARKYADEDLQGMTTAADRWKAFEAMHIGSQEILGEQGRVPGNVVAEYVTHAYLLLWGMLQGALGVRSRAIFQAGPARRSFRTPVLLIYSVLVLLRRERRTGVLICVGIVGAAIGVLGTTLNSYRVGRAVSFEEWLVSGLAVIVLIGVMWLTSLVVRRGSRWLDALIAVLSGAVGLIGAAAGVSWLVRGVLKALPHDTSMSAIQDITGIVAAVMIAVGAILVLVARMIAPKPARQRLAGVRLPALTLEHAADPQAVIKYVAELPDDARNLLRTQTDLDHLVIAIYWVVFVALGIWAMQLHALGRWIGVTGIMTATAAALYNLVGNRDAYALLDAASPQEQQVDALRRATRLKWSTVFLTLTLLAVALITSHSWPLAAIGGLFTVAAGIGFVGLLVRPRAVMWALKLMLVGMMLLPLAFWC